MIRIIKYATLALVLLLMGAGVSFASAVLPSSYGSATHGDPAWQDLSTPASGSGVRWSLDGGVTWGQDTALKIGDTIQFQFSMHKENVGTHYADFLKAWVDWNQNGVFDASDVVTFEVQPLLANESGNIGSYNNPNVEYYTYTSNPFAIDSSMFGDLFLRARVACSESLGSQSPSFDYDAAFLPTGYLTQGEVEEWKLTATPVPPSLLLFGTGLISLVAVHRRRFFRS